MSAYKRRKQRIARIIRARDQVTERLLMLRDLGHSTSEAFHALHYLERLATKSP